MLGCSEIDQVSQNSTKDINEITENSTEGISTTSESSTQEINETSENSTEEIDETTENSTEDINETIENSTEQTNTEIDKTGDYIGDIPCPLPPIDSSYTVYNLDDYNECIAIYVTNIDNCNIKFHITKAIFNEDSGKSEESIIFAEHIAHYNGNEYYEYIGENYHLFFKYHDTKEEPELPANKTIEVYGLENLYDLSQYGEVLYYNEISGNKFMMNVPFAG